MVLGGPVGDSVALDAGISVVDPGGWLPLLLLDKVWVRVVVTIVDGGGHCHCWTMLWQRGWPLLIVAVVIIVVIGRHCSKGVAIIIARAGLLQGGSNHCWIV